MNRYLLFISYIGTRFKGIQKTINITLANSEEIELKNKNTVQEVLEYGLRRLNPVNPVEITLSSRTDAGVHALNSSVHVDLERPDGLPYDANAITLSLNKNFLRYNVPVRINKTLQVPNTFHARFNAKSRTYVYRFAVARDNFKTPFEIREGGFLNYIPFEETDRCHFLQNAKFNVDMFNECAKMFAGRHNFETFMGMSSNVKTRKKFNPSFCVRRIFEVDVQETRPMGLQFTMERSTDHYRYFEIKLTGRSFLYRQVRRIVGALFAVASGKISQKDIYEMLTIPSQHSWLPIVKVAPPYALYLCNVHYDDEDLSLINNTISSCTSEESINSECMQIQN